MKVGREPRLLQGVMRSRVRGASDDGPTEDDRAQDAPRRGLLEDT
jgi:hypothetical protein